MLGWKGLPRIKRGTPPTPENPGHSNEWVFEYSDGSCSVFCGPFNARVLQEYGDALIRYPDSAELLSSYAWALYFNGRYEKALDAIERAIALNPTEPSIRRTYSVFLKRVGRIAESETQSQEAFRLQVSEEREPGTRSAEEAKWSLLRPVTTTVESEDA